MKIDKQWIPGTNFREVVLKINQKELMQLQNALKASPVVKKAQAKYDKYLDIHEGGEATEKQEDKLMLAGEELETYTNFLNLKL